jgi:pyridoxamine 5'-phosphate oxidase
MINIADLRKSYERAELDEHASDPDPLKQFTLWFEQALKAELPEPNAMTLATVGENSRPSTRLVLIKSFDERGIVWYTNYDSRKGRELAANPRAALCFFWQPLERQVRVEGMVERVGRAESDAYFQSRPRQAQIGAWVSQQSSPLTSRAELERIEAELQKRFANSPVPLPDYWGGFRVVPRSIEFWQGRPSRLHDRLLYTRGPSNAPGANEAGWTLRRLSP